MTIRQLTNSPFGLRAVQRAARPQIPDVRRLASTHPVRLSRGHSPRRNLIHTIPKPRKLEGIGTVNRIGYLWDTVLQEVKRA